jgi:hypothetical protein
VAINLERQDEDGAVLSRYSGPALDLAWIGQAKRNSPCLGFIDPYGDTTFNQRQIEALLLELNELRAGNHTLQAANTAVREFLNSARTQVHTYVKFIGD